MNERPASSDGACEKTLPSTSATRVRRSRWQQELAERTTYAPASSCWKGPIPVYSLIPGTGVFTPEQAHTLLADRWKGDLTRARAAYPVLPWSMEELLQTTWRNAFSGGEVRVTHLALDGWGEVSLFGENRTRCGYRPRGLGLGFWLEGRYLLEGWVRTDMWPPTDLLSWFLWEEHHVSKLIAGLEEQIASAERHGDTVNSRAHTLARNERFLEVQWIRQQRLLFTATHGLLTS